MEASRRDFLRWSAVGLATHATKSVSPSLRWLEPLASRAISVWVTNDSLQCAASPGLEWKPGSPGAPLDISVTLNPSLRFQAISGFGAAFTDASCYMFGQLSAEAREQLFHQLFDPSQMAFNVCRTCIGASDYSTKLYSYDETPEPDRDLAHFSIEHDNEYIIPALRLARKTNPDLFLFSSPWSPPGWMKINRSMLGGIINQDYWPSYANYFVKFLQAYAAAGVPVQAITVQNEVDTDQAGRMPACAWPQEYEVNFVGKHLGPAFASKHIDTRIWIIDHNYNLWGRALAELEDPGIQNYAGAIAWHGYVGQASWMDRVQQRHPDIEMHWTEGGPAFDDPHCATDWTKWSMTFTDILRHGCRSITAWNFALDEKGKPNIGPFNCGGLVTVNRGSKAISYSGQYHAFAHYSRFVRRGAMRFDSQSDSREIQHVAFANPDGGSVLVVTNHGSSRKIHLQFEAMSTELALDANSVTTLTW